MGTLQKKVAASSSWQRVDGQTTQATIVTGSSVLQRIIVTGDGAAATLLVSDGDGSTAANILNILEVPSGTSETFEFGANMSNGISVTPGEATTDSVVIYN